MIRVKCLEDEVARLKGENSTLRTSLAHQQQGHKRQLDTETGWSEGEGKEGGGSNRSCCHQ